MNPVTLRRIVEDRIINLDGNSFQGLCDRLCMKLYPDDYTPVRAGGPKGDLKNDGYCPKARIFFAAHATRGETIYKTKRKIKSDLEGCLKKHTNIASWIFLTNDTLVGEVEKFVDELREKHSNINIKTWGHKRIGEKICEFPEKIIGEIIDLAIEPTVEITAEIDFATSLLKESKPLEAMVVLERIWSQHNDKMTKRQRFRVQANIGHSYQELNDFQAAARQFLKAKQHDPSFERARALEALGNLWLGNKTKAQKLSKEVLDDSPEETIAISVHIRSTPLQIGFDEIKVLVPDHLHADPEIAMALAEAAMVRGLHDVAEEYASKVLNQTKENVSVKEAIGDMLIQRANLVERLGQERTATKEEFECLNKACSLYSDAMNTYQKQGLLNCVARLRWKRSEAYLGLDEEDKSENDCIIAYELDTDNVEIVFKYAGIKEKHGELDRAIELLESLIGKGYRPLIEMRISWLLSKRGNDGDNSRILDLLKSRIKDLDKESPEIRTEYLAFLSDTERQLNGKESALAVINDVPAELVSDEIKSLLSAEILRLEGDIEGAVNIAKKLASTITKTTSLYLMRRNATILQALGLHSDALLLWKQIVIPDYVGTDTYRAIECARQFGDIKYIIDFSEKLRSNGLWDKRIFELELSYREQYNDWRGCKKILQEYIESPLDETYLPYARAHLSHVAGMLEEINLIETDLSRLPSPWEVNAGMGRLIVQSLRLAGKPEIAIEFAYELVRKHWDLPEVHMTMGSFMVPIGPKQVEVKMPEVVSEGTAVRYKEEGTEGGVWHIIENSQLGDLDAARREYSVDHAYSQRMLGLKKGDTFLLRGGSIQERRATIMEILSKYDYRIGDCMEGFEDRFPENEALIKINAYREDGEIDLEPMKRIAEMGEKRGEELLHLYRKQPVPIYFLAVKMGKDLHTTLQNIIGAPDLEVQCRLGNAVEVETAVQALEEVEEIVVDEMALTTLLFCEICEHLAKIPKKLVVSEGTLLKIENWEVLRVDPDNPGASLGIVNGQLTFTTRTKEEVEEAHSKIRELIKFIRDKCMVESGVALSNIESSKRDVLVNIVGQTCAESMAMVSSGQRVFWTDDFASGVLLVSELGGRRVWTQIIFEHFAGQGLIDAAILHELTLKLVSFGYWFTSLNAETAIEAITKSDWDVNSSPLKEVLAHFGNGRVKVDANLLLLIGRFLKHIWIEDQIGLKASVVTVRVLNELAKRENALNLIKALWVMVKRLFGVDVITGQRVKSVFENWFKGGGGTIIIA